MLPDVLAEHCGARQAEGFAHLLTFVPLSPKSIDAVLTAFLVRVSAPDLVGLVDHVVSADRVYSASNAMRFPSDLWRFLLQLRHAARKFRTRSVTPVCLLPSVRSDRESGVGGVLAAAPGCRGPSE